MTQRYKKINKGERNFKKKQTVKYSKKNCIFAKN